MVTIQENSRLAKKYFVTGQLDLAEYVCKQILEQTPFHPDSLHILGMIAHSNGQHHDAIKLIAKSIEHDPLNFKFYNNAGCVYKALNNLDSAIRCYKKSIEIDSTFVSPYINLGHIYNQLKEFDEAIYYLKIATEIDSSIIEAFGYLGTALKNNKLYDEAALCFIKVVEKYPENVIALNNLGILFYLMCRFNEAIDCFNKTLSIKSCLDDGSNNPTCDSHRFEEALIGFSTVKLSQGFPDEAIDAIKKILYENPECYKVRSVLLMMMNYSERYSQEDIFEESRKFETLSYQLPSYTTHQNCFQHLKPPHIAERIRVAFVSSDFKNHPVSSFFEPLLKYIDKGKFETFCYSDVLKPDDVTIRLNNISEHWMETALLRDDDLLQLIRENKINILIDLSGHTAGNRLSVFLRRAAPVQISWLGYPNTTGLSNMDFRLTDDIADPVGDSDKLYSERLVRLKNGFLCYQPPENASEPTLPPLVANGYVTFGSFNNSAKISSDVLLTWAKILRRVKNSRLLLKCQNFGDSDTKARFHRIFSEFGISAERIIIMPMISEQLEHLKLYNNIDVALDTFPYNGTTTTLEALWMGVPVITMAGARHSSRVGASILTRLGLADLIAYSSSQYIDFAECLSKDFDRLKMLHLSLRNILKNSSLCNPILFANDVSEVFVKMVK